MAEVQSQPALIEKSELGSQAADKDALVARLDELLEKYLHTIDEYQKAREQLSKQLSSVSFDSDSCFCNVVSSFIDRAIFLLPRQISRTALARTSDRTTMTSACKQFEKCNTLLSFTRIPYADTSQ